MSAPEEKDLDELIGKALDGCDRDHTVALLQAVQAEIGYLPMAAIETIAERTGGSSAEVYGVATFYNQFRFIPPGKRHVRVCLGTACHIKGGKAILDEWERKLGIDDGGVTEDRAYSLERVACVGCCALAPVAVIGEAVHGRATPASVDDLMTRYRLEDEREEKNAEGESSA